MLNLDRLRVFYCVAKHGSLTRTAKLLNVSQPGLSRSIEALEQDLGTKLFFRQPRGLILTTDGKALFAHVSRAMDELDAGERLVRHEISSTLTVMMMRGFADGFFMDHVPSFMRQHPQLHLNILCREPPYDLRAGHADAAILPDDTFLPANAGLVRRYLMTMHVRLWASAKYLAEFGVPKTSSDLDHHRLIGYADAHNMIPAADIDWLMTAGASTRRRPYLVVNSNYCLAEAARNNMGIVALAEETRFLRDTDLIRVLPDLLTPTYDTYFVYPEELRCVPTLRALEKFVLQVFAPSTADIALPA
jgi:DNA-binding transcriptional LysR family regulator